MYIETVYTCMYFAMYMQPKNYLQYDDQLFES